MSLIKGIHHVSMKCCSDAEYRKTVSFYRDILGLSVARSWPTGIMFHAGTGLIELFTDGSVPLQKGVIRHFALATDDLDACVKAVRDAGYEIFLGPKDLVIPSSPAYPARIAFCHGPLGEEIEFFQEK